MERVRVLLELDEHTHAAAMMVLSDAKPQTMVLTGETAKEAVVAALTTAGDGRTLILHDGAQTAEVHLTAVPTFSQDTHSPEVRHFEAKAVVDAVYVPPDHPRKVRARGEQGADDR